MSTRQEDERTNIPSTNSSSQLASDNSPKLKCCKCSQEATLICTACNSLFCWKCHKTYGVRKFFGSGMCAVCKQKGVEAKGHWYFGKKRVYICADTGRRFKTKEELRQVEHGEVW